MTLVAKLHPFYQNEGVCHLAAAAFLAPFGEQHLLTTLAAHLPGKRGSACISRALQVQTA